VLIQTGANISLPELESVLAADREGEPAVAPVTGPPVAGPPVTSAQVTGAPVTGAPVTMVGEG
jgi:hypothetical protein